MHHGTPVPIMQNDVLFRDKKYTKNGATYQGIYHVYGITNYAIKSIYSMAKGID